MIAKHACLLTEDQVSTLHDAALTILEEVGLLVRNETARDVYKRHGCRVNAETARVVFPRAVVEQWRQSFPAEFRLFGRDPRFDVTLPHDAPAICTASAAPDVIDLETGEARRATSVDIARMAHLVNDLPGLDVFSISTLADDAPEGLYGLTRFYAAVKNCHKPVMSGSQSPKETDDIIRLGEIVAGGKAAYWERQFIHFVHCSTISPLTMDVDSTEVCLDFARRGITSLAAVVPNGGLTAPLTLAGILAVANAEFLAVNILPQMVKEGTPVVYYTLPTVGDMRTGAYASGGIECGMLHMACAQLARFYGVPSGGYIGLTNAKLPDAQAGFEKAMSSIAGMLGGADLLVMAGLIDALLAFSFPQAVIDGEIGEMIKQAHRGIPFDPENLALDLIREIGPGGLYLDSPHTHEHMRTAAYLPTIADRLSRHEWTQAGRLDARDRAMQRVRDILTTDNPAVFAADVDARIRQTFAGLPAGDSVPPSSWTQGSKEG